MAEEGLLERQEFEQVIDDLRKRIDAKTAVSAGGGGVPSGVILIKDAACPAGWTRVSDWDNHFIEGQPAYAGPAGAATHTHDGSAYTLTAAGNHQHTYNLGAGITNYPGYYYWVGGGAWIAAWNHTHYVNPPAGNTELEGVDHNVTDHPFAGATGNASEHQPPYVDVIFCKKD